MLLYLYFADALLRSLDVYAKINILRYFVNFCWAQVEAATVNNLNESLLLELDRWFFLGALIFADWLNVST